MDIHLPSTPRHLKITPTMIDDFLIDPVMGMKVIMGITLDAFQKARVRMYWWVPDVIDSSGFGTGKSFCLWATLNLRAMLIGDQVICTYYQNFDAGKRVFWPLYRQIRAPIFRGQLGKEALVGPDGKAEGADGKANTRGSSCYMQYFKNESEIQMPAPNWMQEAKGQAGLSFNVAAIDEWTKIETMTPGLGKTAGTNANVTNAGVGGINQQILGRVRRPSWNQHHPLWGNHRIFCATAESTMHPGFARYRNFQREVDRGNPNYAIISYSFKDFSNQPTANGKTFKDEIADWKTIASMKAQFTRAHYLREVLGIWARETKGWYSEEALQRCVALGAALGTQPESMRGHLSLTHSPTHPLTQTVSEQVGKWVSGIPGGGMAYYFLGVDPAPATGRKSDDGALVALRVRPKPGLAGEPTANLSDWQPEYVWARRLRGVTTRQWAGLIHQKHQHFGFSGMLMDPSGGGQWIMGELNKSRQLINGIETECQPIASPEDITVGNAQFILSLFKRGDAGINALWPILHGDDNLVDAMHTVFQEAIEHSGVAFPVPFNERKREETEAWDDETQWSSKLLDLVLHQLNNIQVATRDDGTWALTRHSAKQFSAAAGLKDLAYAAIFAYIRFLIWLKMGELEWAGQQGGEYYSVMK